MGRIKDLNSALPTENDAFVFDGANGTKRLSYAEFKQKLIDDGFGSGSSEAVVLTQAEYDALPDEVKDSDTIFFISDAPFENSNVVTLTRAEYDALSDATKMDGRFYYITDEAEVAKSLVVQNNVNSTETVPSSAVVYGLKADTDSQISEILDNNVGSNLITWNSAYTWSDYKNYSIQKLGKLIILNLNAYKISNASNGIPRDVVIATIAEGYRPKAHSTSNIGLAIYGNSPDAASNTSVGSFYINPDGTIRHSIGSSKIYSMYTQIIYVLP